MEDDNNNDALIGKIYETALSPGDWVELLDTIAGWTDSRPPSADPGSSLATRQTSSEVDQLIDHLERAVRSSAYMHALEDRTQVLNAMYNQMPWPMLMLDDGMQVLECNPVARQVLADGPVQLHEDGSLLFADRELKQALDRINRMAEGRETRLISSSQDGVSLLCLPVQKSDAPGTISQLRTIVWVLAGHSVVTPSPEMLRSLFNISQAESRLLHLLCKIGNLSQTAECQHSHSPYPAQILHGKTQCQQPGTAGQSRHGPCSGASCETATNTAGTGIHPESARSSSA